MSFKIHITKTEYQEVPGGQAWEVTGKKDKDGDDIYNYTPKITKTKAITTDILVQEVELLNLIAVIKAVNKIGE